MARTKSSATKAMSKKSKKSHSSKRGSIDDNLRAVINAPTVRRLARRANAVRISGKIVDEVRKDALDQLKKIVTAAAIYAEHARRATLSAKDVEYALKNSLTLYGIKH
jgi:histone H3/H4